MALFSALRDGYHNWNHDQSRKSRRGRRHSRPSRALTFSRVELLEARQLLSGATIYVDVNSTSTTEAGTQANPYHHIQEAINASQAGDTLSIAPGTYAEALDITHPLQLLGPNAGINPNTGSRTAEAVIIPPVNNPGGGIDILVQANNVTIDGLTIDGHNDALSGDTVYNGIAVNAGSGISNVDIHDNEAPITGLLVQNNIIRNFNKFGVIGEVNNGFTSTGNAIRYNNIDNVPFVDSTPFPSSTQGRGISIESGFYADVTGNVITRCATGIQAIGFETSSGSAPSMISDNTIQAYDRGILLDTLDTGTPTFDVAGNTISVASGPYTSATNAGLEISWALGSTTVTATDNTITGTQDGVKLDYDTTPNLTVSGGQVSGAGVGVLLTNANPEDSTPQAVLGNLS
ncbi:MAG: DUF1565 domain-containing protein, partial [Planctomycetaceae bacterium]|nr:DUF1565 domain-containing protein [Planctomycetaceae bacterium]